MFLVNKGLWCLRCRVFSFATGGPWIGLSHQHVPRVPRLHLALVLIRGLEPIAEPPSVPPRSSRPLIAFWLNQGARIECQKGRPSGILSPPIRRPILQMMHSWLSQKNKWKGDNNVATSNWTKRTSSVCHIQNGLAMQMWDPRLLHVKLSDQNYARRMLTTPDKHSLHIKYLEG